jgi:predicted membrane protein
MKLTVAFAFIGVGVLLLLQAIQLLPPNHDTWQLIGEFWPVLLCTWGLEWSLPLYFGRRGGRLFPTLLFVAGALLLLGNTGVLVMHHFDPLILLLALLLLFVGLNILSTSRLRIYPFGMVVDLKPERDHVRIRARPIKQRTSGAREDSVAESTIEEAMFTQERHDSRDEAGQSFAGQADDMHADDGEWSAQAGFEFDGGAAEGNDANFRFAASAAKGHLSWPLAFGEYRFGDEPWALEPIRIKNFFGEVRINLGTATIPEGTTTVEINGGFGEVRVLVPEDLPVDAAVRVGAGEVWLFGENRAGFVGRDTLHHTDVEFADAQRRVVLRIHVHVGEVRVSRVM